MKTCRRRLIFVAAAMLALLIPLAVMVNAAAPWDLFGDALAVKAGVGLNVWAIQLRSDNSPGWGGVDFNQPQGSLTFSELYQLSADFNVTDDDCGGGSPRFQLNMDTDNDGDSDGNIFVHFGPSPSFSGCSSGWQSTGNLIGNNDTGRYDSGQVGGSGFGTYTDALNAVGPDATVLGVQVVVDSGWLFVDGEQTILVDNITINDHVLAAFRK